MISIIVPVYNAEKYIENCCHSLINQTYKHLEIIFVDDGSTDNSGNILDDLKKLDERITVLYKTNGGVSSARNTGLEICRGKYVMFCDADDIPADTWCEELRNAIENYPDRLPVCWLTAEGPEFKDGKKIFKLTENCNADYFQAEKEYLINLEKDGLLYSPCNKIFLTDIIKKYNIRFDQSEKIGEDADFNFKYLRYTGGKTIIINQSLYNYIMQNENSATKSSSLAWLHAIEFIFTVFEELYYILDINNKCSREMFYAHYWNKYITSLTQTLTNKSISKHKRVSAGLSAIRNKGFQSCLSNAPVDIIQNKNLVSILSKKSSVYMYLFKKVFLNK